MHFAAESHVDRSIDNPSQFVVTNVLGTFQMLDAALRYWSKLAEPEKSQFRFLHVSTDEVYGSLGPTGCSRKRPPTIPVRPIRPPRPRPTISRGRTTAPTACRCW